MQLANLLWGIMGLMVGACVGLGFGMVQERALRRNENLQRDGKLDNGWSVMPRSTGRVFYLIIALVLIQAICPMLFANGMQWWVSGGVVAGYGYILVKQLRKKISGR